MMNLSRIQNTVRSQRWIGNGDRFTQGDVISAVMASFNEVPPRHMVTQALNAMCDSGELLVDEFGYVSTNRSRFWLTRPWRRQSNAALGITDNYTLAYMR